MVQFGYFYFIKRVNFSANFSSYTKTTELTQTRPQGFSVSMPFFVVILHQWCHFFGCPKLLWSTLAGHEELARGFELIRNGEIFWMNNKVLVFRAHSQSTKHVAAARKVSPNWLQETITCHSANSIVWSQGNAPLMTSLPSSCYMTRGRISNELCNSLSFTILIKTTQSNFQGVLITPLVGLI